MKNISNQIKNEKISTNLNGYNIGKIVLPSLNSIPCLTEQSKEEDKTDKRTYKEEFNRHISNKSNFLEINKISSNYNPEEQRKKKQLAQQRKEGHISCKVKSKNLFFLKKPEMIYGISKNHFLLKSSPKLRILEQEEILNNTLKKCYYDEEEAKKNPTLNLGKLAKIKNLNQEEKKLYISILLQEKDLEEKRDVIFDKSMKDLNLILQIKKCFNSLNADLGYNAFLKHDDFFNSKENMINFFYDCNVIPHIRNDLINRYYFVKKKNGLFLFSNNFIPIEVQKKMPISRRGSVIKDIISLGNDNKIVTHLFLGEAGANFINKPKKEEQNEVIKEEEDDGNKNKNQSSEQKEYNENSDEVKEEPKEKELKDVEDDETKKKKKENEEKKKTERVELYKKYRQISKPRELSKTEHYEYLTFFTNDKKGSNYIRFANTKEKDFCYLIDNLSLKSE